MMRGKMGILLFYLSVLNFLYFELSNDVTYIFLQITALQTREEISSSTQKTGEFIPLLTNSIEVQ